MRTIGLLLLAACGTSVKGSAHVVRGATTQSGPRIGGVAPATAGHWFLSPTSGTVDLTKLTFKGPGGASDDVDLSSCKPTYQRDTAELTSILDCPFEVGTGTYTTLTISVAGAAQVTIDDPSAGLYTDGAGLVTTAPAGGAQPTTITVPTAGSDGNQITAAFPQPLVVKDGSPVSITILEDMIHTVYADVSGTSAQFDLSLPAAPVALLATAGDVTAGSVEYYSPLGTAADYTSGQPGTGNETGSARIFFIDGQPSFVWHVTLGNSEAWAADPPGGNGSRAGGYLGMDASGTICWAQTQSDALLWPDTNYSMVCRMQHLTKLGDSTQIECLATNTAPLPTSGPTYASGCPSFTPTTSTKVTLVAR